MLHREGTGAKCRCLLPLCKQWHKDKPHVFSSACSLHTALEHWNPHSLEFTPPLEWFKTVTNFSALQVPGAWVVGLISLSGSLEQELTLPLAVMVLGSGFMTSILLDPFDFLCTNAPSCTGPCPFQRLLGEKALAWLPWWLPQRLLKSPVSLMCQGFITPTSTHWVWGAQGCCMARHRCDEGDFCTKVTPNGVWKNCCLLFFHNSFASNNVV